MFFRSWLNNRNVLDLSVPLLMSVVVVVLGKPDAITYTFAFFLFALLASLADCCKKSVALYSLFVVFLVGTVSIFTGFRDFGVGWDTDVYIRYYFYEAQNAHNIKEFMECFGDKGFLALSKLSSLCSSDAQSLLYFESLFIILFVCLGILELNKGSVQAKWSTVLFFWCFTFLNISLNLMRQYCAMSLLFWAFALLLNDKWRRAVAVIFVAYFFHSSAILFLLAFAYFYLSNWKDRKIRMWVTVVGLLCVLISVLFVFKLLPLLAGYGIISDIYANRYGANNNYKSENIFGLGIIAYIVVVYYAIYLMKIRKAISDKLAYICFTTHSLFLILRLAAFSVNYLSRMSAYYYYFDMLCICILLNLRQLPKWIRYSLYFLTVFLWYRSYISGNAGFTYPYHSAILGI